MRIAHFSDLHVLALEGVKAHRFFNKRFTGWVNLRLKRAHKHRPGHVRAVAREIARAGVDHVAITGDLTNLALEQEFEAVKELLESELGLPADRISAVPGNHDLYTRGAMRDRRFTSWFSEYVKSDLPELSAEISLGRFPFVKLRGPVAIIGLSSAVPRPPLMASGQLGKPQLEALRKILDHAEVKKRTPIVLMHHPIHNPASRVKTFVEGLWDADALAQALHAVPRALLLHGHLHVRRRSPVGTPTGDIISYGATSASLHHEHEHRMAGFNLYDIDDGGALVKVEAHVLDPRDESFHVEQVPLVA
ncbi:MAG: metallophosphoesterase [Deltaproteobacteria bacterium]|nr:metallophosphoesterase [Deltaproteobacteria bacterium]